MGANIGMLESNLKLLHDIKSQNDNEKMMMEEDLAVSDMVKMDLVFQRE